MPVSLIPLVILILCLHKNIHAFSNIHCYFYILGPHLNHTELLHFRKFRFNRIQRLYENVWLWKDINIGPHGRYIFEIPVPHRPAHWMVTAFSMSPRLGFGMIPKPIEVIIYNLTLTIKSIMVVF